MMQMMMIHPYECVYGWNERNYNEQEEEENEEKATKREKRQKTTKLKIKWDL